MRVLLVYANRSRDLTAAPPVGLSYVATAARDAGHEVALVDLLVADDRDGALRRAVRERRPEVVGISVRNIDSASKQRPGWQMGDVARHIETVRASGSARVVIGGPAVSVLGPAVLESLPADYAVVGEGEIAFPALLRVLERGEPVRGIPGVYARRPSGVHGTEPDRLAGFGRSGMERWIDWPAYRRRGGTWAIQTKRGCPLHCVYCAYPGIEGAQLRRRTPQEVADEIEHVMATVRPKTFEIVDSTFNVPTSHAMEICEEITRRNLRVRLTTMGVNPIGVTAELFPAMRRAGFRSMMVSPDAASETTLGSLKKGFTVPELRKTAGLAKASGLRSAWFFILGGPGETRETVDETMRFVETELNHPRCLTVVMTGVRILPGTEMAALAVRERIVPHDHDYAAPTFYVSPAVDETWILGRVQRALARNPGVVHAGEQNLSRSERLLETVLQALGVAPPYWCYLPLLLRMPPLRQLRRRFPPAFAPTAPPGC